MKIELEGLARKVLIPSSSGLKAGQFFKRQIGYPIVVLIPSSSGLKAGPTMLSNPKDGIWS